MARFTCTNCGYTLDNIHSSDTTLSCPGCRHRLETDGELESEIAEHDHIFFDELMSGQAGELFYADEFPEQTHDALNRGSCAADVPAGPRQYTLRFDGSASDFWGIWFVNVAASIMTLGIFMIWGRKRTRKYFMDNILIDDLPLASVKDHEMIYERITECCTESKRIGGLSVQRRARAAKLFWIRISNMLAIIISLGLLVPWAKVRRFRYVVRNSTLFSERALF